MSTNPLPTLFPAGKGGPLGGGGGTTGPFAASTVSGPSGNPPPLYLSAIAGGLIFIPLTLAPALTVADYTPSGTTDQYGWLVVSWDASYNLTAATLASGTAWPSGATYNATAAAVGTLPARSSLIPVAYINAANQLVQVVGRHLMLHPVEPIGGFVFAPAAL